MPTVTLRPYSTTYNDGAVTGAATAHAALADASDASSVACNGGESVIVTLTPFVLPANAVTSQLRLRLRASGTATSEMMALYKSTLSPSGGVYYFVAPGTPTDLSGPFVTFAKSQAELNTSTLTLQGLGESAGVSTLIAAYVDLVYVIAPTVVVTAPTGVVATTAPTVEWVHTPGADGGAQTHYQLRVFTAAQYGIGGFNPSLSPAAYDTGDVASGASSRLGVGPLANAVYRVYARTAQTVNGAAQWSDWSYGDFTVTALPPLIATVVALADSPNARTRITVARNAASPTWETLAIERSIDNGATWSFVRGVAGTIMPGDVWIGYDYEAPNGVAVIYRARATSGLVGATLTGPWVQSGAVTWAQSGIDWLKDLARPSRSMPITVESLPSLSRDRAQGIFTVIGRADPVAVSDVLQLAVGTLTVLTLDDDDATRFEALCQDDVLLLQVRPADRFGARYLSIGAVSESRTGQVGDATRRWTLPFVEIASPADFIVDVPGLTWADIITTYATWTAFAAGVATWGDLV